MVRADESSQAIASKQRWRLIFTRSVCNNACGLPQDYHSNTPDPDRKPYNDEVKKAYEQLDMRKLA